MNRKLKIGLFSAGVVLGGWLLLSPLLSKFLIIERRLERADAIVVLSGSAAYDERTRKAAELFTLGVAPKIYISNDGQRAGWSKKEQTNLPFVELARRSLISYGVPADAIIELPGEMSGTESEARAIAAEAGTGQIGSVMIVTSDYHTRRAFCVFESVFAGTGVEIGIASASSANFPTFADTAGEYVKLAAYWAFY